MFLLSGGRVGFRSPTEQGTKIKLEQPYFIQILLSCDLVFGRLLDREQK